MSPRIPTSETTDETTTERRIDTEAERRRSRDGDASEGTGSSTTRRALLRTAGALGAATLTGTSGCLDLLMGSSSGGAGSGMGSIGDVAGTVSTSINPENYAAQFDQVVNAVAQGADPTGETPIDGVLNSYARPGTLLFFPEGTYTMASTFSHTGGGDIGIIGQNATLKHSRVDAISGHTVTSGAFRGDTILFAIGRASSPHSGTLVLGGFTVDDREENHGMQLLRLYTTGLADVKNIRFVGQQDLGTRGPFRAMTRADDALAMFRNIDFREGSKHAANTINSRTSGLRDASFSTTGIALGPSMSGTMLFENVICGPYPDNGLYTKGGLPKNNVGRKILRNCVAANSNVASLRLNSGDDWVPHPRIDGNTETPADGYEQSVVENCHVIVDNAPSAAYGNQRGIRLDDGDPVLRNTTVEIYQPNGHAINVQGGTNGATVENCRVDLHAPEIAIRVSGDNTELRGNTVNLVGFDGVGRALSGISDGNGVAVNRINSRPGGPRGPTAPPRRGNSGGSGVIQSALNSQAEIGRFDGSHASNVSIAPDPLGANRNVTRVSVGQNDTRGGSVAWAPRERRDGSRTGENDPDAVHSRYYVYFPESTQMYDPSESNHGTKLPGLAGFYDGAGNGGAAGNGYSWSARLQTDVAQENSSNSAFTMNSYTYHMDQTRPDGYGDLEPWDGAYGFGTWHKVDLFVQMNTPGEHDGVLRGWMNDTLAFERTDLRFRSTDHPSVGVTRAHAAYIYWGGKWGSPKSQSVYFKDFSVTRGK